MTSEIEALVGTVPSWQGRSPTLRPLHGGITNRNFVVTVDGRDYVVRIPGERTELLGIDRANESEAAERAAQLGIGPPVLGELPTVGTLITELVDGHHLDLDAFATRIGDVVDLVRRFHRSGAVAGAFPIHRVVEWHARDATIHGVIPPGGYDRLHQHSRRIEAAFAASPTAPVPCHNDLLPANVLLAPNGRVWLIDYEYAGMNHAMFDLANLSVNCGFDDRLDSVLLHAAFDTVTDTARAELALMKIVSECREGLWALVQSAICVEPAIDYEAYAGDRLANCSRLAADPVVNDLLDVAGR